MNKKGFTLTELLAVIVILGVVMLIGTVSVTGIQSKMKQNMFEENLKLVITGANNWGQKNKSLITSSGLQKKLEDLMIAGDIASEEIVKIDSSFSCNEKLRVTENGVLNTNGGYCKVITNDATDKVINSLTIKVYRTRGDRISSCIEKTVDNYKLLEDNESGKEGSKYSHLNLYCS